MRPVYDESVTREDGTPLRKYELREVTSSRAGTRFALTLILGNMFLLLKNVFFPEETRHFGANAAESGGRDPLRAGEVKAERGGNAEEDVRQEIAEVPLVEDLDELPVFRFKKGSSTSLDLIDEERPSGRIPGFAYSSGTPLIASNDNPVTFSISSELSLSNLNSSSGSEGGSGGGKANNDERDDEEEPRTPPRSNRLPVVTAPIVFDQILGNQSVLIMLSDLLRNAHDPDGDAMKIVGLRSSKGDIVEIKPGTFSFTPDAASLGPVTFSYFVSDGSGNVRQTAIVTVFEPEGERIQGTAGADVLVGTAEDDVIEAREGGDTVVALDGDDVIYGGDGADRILGGSGHDVIFGGDGDDVIFAGAGNDVVSGGKGRDTILGEEGKDTLFGDDDGDIISGGADDDTIDGGTGDDVLQGDEGDDILFGQGGQDHMEGNDGDDRLDGGSGEDFLEGGAGHDTMLASVGDDDDVYDGGDGVDTYDISATFADATIDLFAGRAESDDIRIDTLIGIENVVGGSGRDIIVANHEVNFVSGGEGDDIFVFRTTASAGHGPGSRDRILDFEVGDKIDLDDISREFAPIANALEDDGIKKFVLIKSTDGFKRPGELRFKYDDDGGATILEGNIDRDLEAEFEIEIMGVRDLQDHDFTWNV